MAKKVSKETFALENFGFRGWKLCTCTILPSKGVKAWRIFALRVREKWPHQILNKRTGESGTFTWPNFEQ